MTTASGETRAASRSSASFERISWNEPIPMFETRIPRKSASRHEANAIVRQPKTKRIAFGVLSVFALTMLRYERLERERGSRPRAARRRAASASVRPEEGNSTALAIRRRYRAVGPV